MLQDIGSIGMAKCLLEQPKHAAGISIVETLSTFHWFTHEYSIGCHFSGWREH